jgi:alkanesulfonate monooxygenase SsuD/methylene tetrahydromethanopterin reductase-like flavin-dependent oxidoreductase (luciferase family)
MKFAHFAHVWGKIGMAPAQRYQQLWRELRLCDELGVDYGFCVEHHFRPDESWMSAPSMYAVAAGARTKNIRLGPMGYIVPLHHPLRLAEEIALADQMLEGRFEVGLVPGILPAYFEPFKVDYAPRREVTMEFVRFLKVAYPEGDATFDFSGKFHQHKGVKLGVNPAQRPHPPLWMETRDPATLDFCAEHGINTGYFLLFPRTDAAPRYRKYLADWKAAGWRRKPNIAYSTVVYVDETDDKALDKALTHAGNAYRGFFPPRLSGAELTKAQYEGAKLFEQRGEPGAAEVMRHLVDKDWLLEHDMILLGSPETVARKLKEFATEGMFNTFFAEFNFGELAEDDLMRSIRLFGTEVMPALRGFEPF